MSDDPRKRVETGDEPRAEAEFEPETVFPSVQAVIPNPTVTARLVGRVEKSE